MGFVDRAVKLLDDPQILWRVAFESHLTGTDQALVVVLSTMPGRVEYETLRAVWSSYCALTGTPMPMGSFDRTLSKLEGSFVRIDADGTERFVSYSSPSVADFVIGRLDSSPEIVEALLRSAVYFEQLEELYLYAYRSRWSYTLGRSALPREGIQQTLERLASLFSDGLQRTLESYNPSPRWQRSAGRMQRGIVDPEQRLLFVLGLPPSYRPENEWIAQEVHSLMPRWDSGEGNRKLAVDILGRVRSIPSVDDTAIQQSVEGLLLHEPEDMVEDWAPLLDFAVERFDIRRRAEIVGKFQEFAESELSRWSPGPPNLEELEEYAERFGLLEDLEADFDAVKDRIQQEDREAAEGEGDEPSTDEASPQTSGSSDEEIDLLFACVATWPELDGR
jgi:hypothetical protein